jgi:hypothetical protein
MASQLCQRLASNPLLRADKDELSECSINYEELGVELLNSVRESDDAMDLITLMPWEWGSGRRHLNKRKQAKEDAANSSHFGRELLWDYSVLDIASLGDGRLSRPCMRFVAHRHCQDTLDKFFSGNYTGSAHTNYKNLSTGGGSNNQSGSAGGSSTTVGIKANITPTLQNLIQNLQNAGVKVAIATPSNPGV